MSEYERAQLQAVAEATMLSESQVLRLLIDGATERLEETGDDHQDESLGGRRIRILNCQAAGKRYLVRSSGSSASTTKPKTKGKSKKKAKTKAKTKEVAS